MAYLNSPGGGGMRGWRSKVILPAALIVATACAPSSPSTADRRPLGIVTEPPLECDFLASQALSRAIGLETFYASGTNSPKDSTRCIVSKSPSIRDKAFMLVELHSPFLSPLDSLQYSKAADKGTDLPASSGPGYSAAIKDVDGNSIGAKVFAWTHNGSKMLEIQIIRGAPGRDHRADAIEFARQLRPLLLVPDP